MSDSTGPWWAPNRDEVVFIPVFHYVGRVTESSFAVSLAEQMISQNKTKVVSLLTWSVDDKLGELLPDDTPEALRVDLRQQYDASAEEKADRCRSIILNQLAVLPCTILDGFLADLLSAILKKQPRVLLTLKGETDVPLKRVVESSNLTALLSDLCSREVARFDHSSISDRLSRLKKIGVVIEYEKGEREQLISLYEQRHDIVHRGTRPFSSFNELENAGSAIVSLMFKLDEAASKKFLIPDDFFGPMPPWMRELPEMQEFLQEAVTQPPPKS